MKINFHKIELNLGKPISMNLLLIIKSVMIALFTITNVHKCLCDFVDPGHMFGHDNPALPSSQLEIASSHSSSSSSSFPSLWSQLTDIAIPSGDNSCSAAAEIILKRIVIKLFNHLHTLQPHELDEDFDFQSSLNYDDYVNILKYLNDEKDKQDCNRLNRLNNILSKFMSNAEVNRYGQSSPFTNLFGGLKSSLFSRTLQDDALIHLSTILVAVCLVTWFLRSIAGYSECKSYLFGFLIPGFIQFYIHRHSITINDFQDNLDRCKDPSYIARALNYFNYDLNGCRNIKTSSVNRGMLLSNIAMNFIEYISELVFHPFVMLASKCGQASQYYLNQFTGFSGNFLGPFFLSLILVLFATVIVSLISRSVSKATKSTRNHQQIKQQQQQQQIKKANNSNGFKRIKSN